MERQRPTKEVIHAEPTFAEAYLNLGLAEEQAGKLDAARDDLERALRLKPGLRGANLFLGVIAYHANRFKDAETSLLVETRVDPKSAKAFMWLGVWRPAQDDPQAAIAPLDKAYALDPSDVDILYHRGRAYMLIANASYDAMYKVDHDSLRVHQVLAEAYAQAYRNQDAIGESNLAVKIAPRQPGLHEELGDQEWIVGNFDNATQAYREELRVDPLSVTAKYKLGSILLSSNRTCQRACNCCAKFSIADPSLSDAHYYLGSGLASMSQDQDAIHEFELAIAADPASDRAKSSYYKLAQSYRKLHETQQAQVAMENYLRLRAQYQQRIDDRTAQRVRKRTELPVDGSDKDAQVADN